MSKTIDEKVVSLRFDNRQFERKVSDTLKYVEDLNDGLKFEGASKGLEEVNEAAKKMDFTKIGETVDVVVDKIKIMASIGEAAIQRLTNAVLDFGKRTIDTFAIEPVTTGFQEYQLKMGSVQTIMSATGESIEKVNKYLDELNAYSDRTIYSFSDMTNNIGKFTNAGVKLRDAVDAIKGISNEAALSGANANEASRAMYNFAQALASGSVKLIDWKSIENANMATVQFKEELLNTAAEMGTVARDANGMYQVLTKNAGGASMKTVMNATQNFNDSLSYQWMTSEVLIETLKKYSDETTELGQKAYAAAQDVTTFSAMIDTLKESVQSGWAATWEAVIGDYNQAKATWTEITKFFSGIIESSIEARNKLVANAMLLQNAEGLTGREALWQSLLNILEAVRDILGTVKKAWEDVFPPMSDQRLRGIIESIHQFSERLKLSDDRLKSIRATFRGIFAILDMFVTIVRFTFRVATNLVVGFVGVLKTALFAGFALLLQWIERIKTAESGFNGWINKIGRGVGRFVEYVKSLDGFSLTNILKAMLSFGSNVLSQLFDSNSVFSLLKDFVTDIGIILYGLVTNAENIEGRTKTLVGRLLTWLVVAKDKVVEVVKDLVGKIDFSKFSLQHVAYLGIAVGLGAIIVVFMKFVKSITGIASSISGVFDSISDVISSVGKKIKAEAMNSVAKAIMTMVTALAVLVILASDREKFYVALAVLAGISAALVGIMFVMSKMKPGNTASFAATVIGFGLSMMSLVATLKMIDGIANSRIARSVTILLVVMAGLMGVAKILGSSKKQYGIGAITMLGFVLTLRLLIGVLKDLDQTELYNINTSLQIIFAISAALALVGLGFKNVKAGAALTMLATIALIKSLITSIESFKDLDPAAINKTLKSIGAVFAMFAGLMLVAGIATINLEKFEIQTLLGVRKGQSAAKNLKQLAVAIVAMSVSLLIISAAFKSFSNFSDEDLQKSTTVITNILKVYGLVVALSFFAGANADKAGKMLSKMATSIAVLSLVMVALSYLADPDALETPLKIVASLVALMSLLVAATGLATQNADLPAVLKTLTVSVVLLAAAISAMTFLPDTTILFKVAGSLALVMGAFSLMIAATSKASKVKAVLFVMTGIVATIAGIITGMSVLNVKGVVENAATLSLLLTSLSTSIWILGKASNPEKGIMAKMYAMAGVVSVLSIIVIGMESLATIGGGLTAQIQNAISIGILLNTMASAFFILNKSEDLDKGIMTKLYALSGVVAILAGILGLMAFLDIQASIVNAIALGVLVNALTLAFKWLSGTTAVDPSVIIQLGIMSVIMGLLGIVIAGIMHVAGDVKISIETAISLGILLNAIALACKTVSTAGLVGARAAIVGIGALIVFITAMGLLMWGIGALVRENPNIEQDLDNAIMVMSKISNGLGGMIGGFLNGALQAIDFTLFTKFGQDLNGALLALQPAIEIMNEIDISSFDKIQKLAVAILALTSAELIEGLSKWLTGGNTLSRFGKQLETLGDGLKSFSKNTKEIDQGDHVEYALELMSRLAELGKELPNSGGLLGLIMGNNDMDDWGNQLESLASGLVTFCYEVQGIKYNVDVDNAINVMKKLAKASKEIPNTGGLLGKLIGNNDMEPFAGQMPAVADGIKKFCENIQGLKYGTHIEHGADVLAKLAKASQDIPNIGGKLAAFIGDNRMDVFANQMPVAGEGIKGFCDNIKGIITTNVDNALAVMSKIIDVSKNIERTGGWNGRIFGDIDIQSFGAQITWLGKYLWIYSTWIDKINDYGIMDKSVDIIRSLSDLAIAVTGVNIDKFYAFGSAIPEFAQALSTNFESVFEKTDVESIGHSIGDRIHDGLSSTEEKFTKEGHKIIEKFISGVKFKMEDRNLLKQIGVDVGKKFLEGMQEGLEVESPSKRTKWIGEMSIVGFLNGLGGNQEKVKKAGIQLGDALVEGVQDRLDIHSPSGETSWLGSMSINGFIEGFTGGFNNLLGQFDGLWGKIQNLSNEGISSVKDIIGTNSLWDFSASIGDNLVAAKDKLKEWLGFGDSGGLSDLFGFGSLGDALEEEILDSYGGIQEGMSGLANDIASGKGSASSLAEALKLSMHRHFDSKEFIHLGKQIGENMAIAANNAIVSNAAAMTDILAEAIAVTGGGIDSWKAWLENRKKYDQIALKDQLAGWTLIQKMYAEGTKERMEADEAVYDLQKELVKGTFEYSKKWIDNEKYYERLSLEEELAAWERVQARYLEGSDERIEAEKEVYRIRKEIRQKEYEDAKKWISTEKSYDRLSLADELAAYLRIRKTTEEGSDERLEMDEKIYSLQKEIYEAQQQYTENVKAAQEEAAEERIRLEEEYADKVKEINERLASDIQELNDKYANEVNQRMKSLYSSYGLFESVKEEDFDKDELMQNLEDQVRAFENWQMDINSLAARGLDKGLIDELTEMGPSAAGQIRALNEMTDAELGQYNLLWSQKTSMAREQAISELEDLRVETSDNIAKLQQETASELDKYREEWAAAMAKITEDCDAKLEELRKNFGEKVGTIKKDTAAKMREMTTVVNQILREAGWSETGEQIVTGILSGITKNKNVLITAVGGLATTLIETLKSKLKINSPSKVTEEMGRHVGEGLVKGLTSYYNKARTSGNTLAEEIQNGAFEAIKYVNDLMQNGLDTTVTITPVFDMSNVRAGVMDMNSMLDTTRAMYMASSVNTSLDNSRDISFSNPNENVVQELQSLRKDVHLLSEKVANMQLVMDTGAVVGQITGPLDTALGSRFIRNTRERG